MNDWEAFRIFLAICLAISIISLGIFGWFSWITNLELSYLIGLSVSIIATSYFGWANLSASK